MERHGELKRQFSGESVLFAQELIPRFTNPFFGVHHRKGMACMAAIAIVVAVLADSAVVVAGVGEISAFRMVLRGHTFPPGNISIFILAD